MKYGDTEAEVSTIATGGAWLGEVRWPDLGWQRARLQVVLKDPDGELRTLVFEVTDGGDHSPGRLDFEQMQLRLVSNTQERAAQRSSP